MGFVPTAVRRRRSGGSVPPPSLAAQVQAALAGKAGFYLDPTDLSVMWQDSLKTTPVIAPTNPVYVLTSKYGATTYDSATTADASRPLYDGSALVYDGTDDRMLIQATAFGQNAPALAVVAYVKPAVITGTRAIVQISANTSTTNRFFLRTNADGSVTFIGRRLDADADTTVITAAGLITTGAAYVITAVVDYAGTGGVSIRINGIERATGTLAGTPANTSNTATNRVQFGAVGTGSSFQNGKEGRMIPCAFLPSAGEITLFESLVSDVAI